jgi:LuxR family maltose regulon positive regulatory protein
VLISRTNPPLPLPRLRANDKLTKFRSSELRFTKEETAEYLSRMLEKPLKESSVDKFDERMDG